MTDDPYYSLVELVERLVRESDYRLLTALHYGKDKVFISAPSIVITMLHLGLVYKYNVAQVELSDFYDGAKFYPSSDWAITLYHKDYSLYKKDWMIRKVPLDLPIVFSNQWYSKYVFEVQKLPLVSLKENNQN